MRSYGQELGQVLGQALALAADVGEEAPLSARAGEIHRALERHAPELMFYGCYNAGKSTLLNALLSESGEERAKMSAAPCTSEVTSYRFGGYVVYDTPGIDAPAEHERVSKEHLSKCHIICFVVSSRGSFDESLVAEEVRRLLDLDRTVILIVNDTDGHGMQSEALREKCEKLLSNVRQAGVAPERLGRMDLAMVNALEALEARRNGSAKGYERSGAQALELLILRRLVGMRAMDLLRAPAQLLAEGLAALSDQLSSKLDDEGLRLAQAMLEDIARERQEFVRRVEMDVRGMRDVLTQDIETAIGSGKEKELEHAASRYFNRAQASTQKRFEESLELLDQQLEQVAARFQKQAPSVSPLPSLEEVEERSTAEQLLQKIDLGRLRQGIESKQGVELLKQGLLGLRKLGIPGLKGRWEKTLGKWAARGARGIGIAIEVGMFAYNWKKANDEQRQYEQQQHQARQALRNAAVQAALDLEVQVLQELRRIASELFAPLQQRLHGEASKKAQGQERIQQVLAEMLGLSTRLEDLRHELRQAE